MVFWDLALNDATMVTIFSKTILECCLCGNCPVIVKRLKMCTRTELRKNQIKKKVRKTIKQVIYISPKHACLLYPIIERSNRTKSEKSDQTGCICLKLLPGFNVKQLYIALETVEEKLIVFQTKIMVPEFKSLDYEGLRNDFFCLVC